jgi:hypothetical protein
MHQSVLNGAGLVEAVAFRRFHFEGLDFRVMEEI